MSTSMRLGAILMVGSFLAGCTSLTQSDEIRINKDPPPSAAPEPEPEPTPTPGADALRQARDAPARPARKAGSG